MARSDSGDSSGGSLTSDDEAYETRPSPAGVAPTYAAAPSQLPVPASPTAPRLSSETRRTPRPAAHSRPTLGAAARRFKAAALKVINTHRTSRQGIGAEPGVDPSSPLSHQMYGHLQQPATIDVVDYSAVSARIRRFDNAGLRDWFKTAESERPNWARVRWIHVTAISWDVLALVATRYNIHPLIVESVLQSRSSSRTKASYFSSQLFIRILCHTLAEDSAALHTVGPIVRSESPFEMSEKESTLPGDPDATLGKNSRQATKGTIHGVPSRQSTRVTLGQERWQNRDADIDTRAREAKLQVIKDQTQRVLVNLDNLFIILQRDGTVITIHADAGSSLFDPIKERLRSRDTILRQTVDPSLLVESLLDLVVDEGLDIVDKYQEIIHKLEASVLSRAKLRFVRALHIISGDLALLKRSLDPIKSLVFGLRRYDLDRCIAVAAAKEASDKAKAVAQEGTKYLDQGQEEQQQEQKPEVVVGFMSHKSKIYLADVYDHIEYVMSSLDLFATQAENLISYSFNISSAETNETMRRLTLVTIICLPLTLFTGYFGMNFTGMWSVDKHDDRLFWYIAAPVMAVLIPLFLWADILRGIHKMQKKFAAKSAAQQVRASAPPKRGERTGRVAV